MKKLLKAAFSGVPLLGTIMSFFSVKDADGKVTKVGEPFDAGAFLRLIVELGAVWALCYAMNKYGVTMEDIKDLFGLIK